MGDGTDSAAPRGRLRRRLLALGVSGLLTFAVGEVLLRATQGTPLKERLPISRVEANAYRGWQMVPGELHYTYQHAVRVNALGLRGPELEPKAEGERRVLALGDSLVYGQGVADDQTVPVHLERLLRQRDPQGRHWTVVNAGHRAYDTRQELGLLEELGSTIQPDVVILFWYWNDTKERDIEQTFANLSASGPIAFDTGEAMEGWSKVRWQGRQVLRRSALVMGLHDLLRDRGAGDPPADFVDQAMGRLEGYLTRFLALAERDGFEFLIAPIPDAGGLAGPHPSLAIDARARAVAEGLGLAPCNLGPALEGLYAETGRLPILPYDGHYTGPANAALAGAVADCLLAPN